MTDHDLLSMAPLLGLDALSPAELDSVRRRRAQASPQVRGEFDALVRSTHETMASVSASTAQTPPAGIRDRLIAAIEAERTASATNSHATIHPIGLGANTATSAPTSLPTGHTPRSIGGADGTGRIPRRLAYLAAAAVAAVAVGGIGWAIGARTPTQQQPENATAQKVFSANDVRTSTGSVATGRASVTFSEKTDAAVLVMNDVPPPQPGTVYQMWLLGPNGATSAGTMTDKDVAPSTTAVIPHIGDATSLGFSVEPGGAARAPGAIVAELPLR